MKIRWGIILLVVGFLLLCLAVNAGETVINQQQSMLPVYTLDKHPSKNSCVDVYTLSSDQAVYVRDVSEFPLEPLNGTPFHRKIGRTSEDLEIFSIPENDNYVIVRSIYGFQPEVYRKKSAPPIHLATLASLDVNEIVFSDFNKMDRKKLWSSKDAALIQDILQALDQPWKKLPQPWETHTYRVDLLSDQIKGLSYYLMVDDHENGQIYFYTYEHPGRVVTVGDLFSRSIRTRKH